MTINNENKGTEEIFWAKFTQSFEQTKERYLLEVKKVLEKTETPLNLKVKLLRDLICLFNGQQVYFQISFQESSLFIQILIIFVFLFASLLSSFPILKPFAPKIFSTALSLTKLLTSKVRFENNINIVENPSIIKKLFSYLPEDWRGNLVVEYKRLLRKKASKGKIRWELFKMLLGMFRGTLQSKIEDLWLPKRYLDD